MFYTAGNRTRSLNIITGLRAGWPRNRGSVTGRDRRISFPPPRQKRKSVQTEFGSPPNHLFSRYRQLTPSDKAAGSVKLTAHFRPVPTLRIYGAIPLRPLMLSQAQGRLYVTYTYKELDRSAQCTYVCTSVFTYVCTGMRRITTFRSTTDRIYDGGPIRL